MDVKDVVVLVEEEQETREEKTDSAVHRVETTVLMEILMETSVEDQVTMPLVEAVVEAVGTLEIVEETQAVTVMEQQVEVEETIGQVLTMLTKPKPGLVTMETVETGDIGQETVQVHIMVEQETLPYVMNCNYGTN